MIFNSGILSGYSKGQLSVCLSKLWSICKLIYLITVGHWQGHFPSDRFYKCWNKRYGCINYAEPHEGLQWIPQKLTWGLNKTKKLKEGSFHRCSCRYIMYFFVKIKRISHVTHVTYCISCLKCVRITNLCNQKEVSQNY